VMVEPAAFKAALPRWGWPARNRISVRRHARRLRPNWRSPTSSGGTR
jgi:hypothetical protein